MKLAIKSPEGWGYPYYISEPDKDDPTENVFEVPESTAKRWLKITQDWNQMQKEIDKWYDYKNRISNQEQTL